MRDKLDSSRLESLTDSEETISELRKRHDREKKILLDDNRKLIADLEMLSENNRRLQTERMQMDNDYEELRYIVRLFRNFVHFIFNTYLFVEVNVKPLHNGSDKFPKLFNGYPMKKMPEDICKL